MKNPLFLTGMLFCGILICALGAGCITSDDTPPDPADLSPNVAGEVVNANTLFAYDLYQTLKSDKENAGKNIFFSPYSISTALALTYEGAKGTTADEISSVFHFPKNDTVRQNGYQGLLASLNRPDSAYSLKTANALWAEKTYPLLPAYIETAQKSYSAEVRNMDFVTAPEESRQIINRWVEDQTENRIQNLIPEQAITPLTTLVITNAVYFKGKWVLQFSENNTKSAAFRTGQDTSVAVDMMQRTDVDAHYGYAETDDLQILRMPYEHESGKALSMLVILPKGDDLALAETALPTKELADAIAEMKQTQVEVFFPKFTMETTYLLPKTLTTMGMPTAFGSGADFSGMDGTRDLFISDVIHKAFVEVNEEGTEAAAATGVVIGRGMTVETPVPVFRADHPFVFMITDDETEMVLFMGRMADPTA
ncbi:MAG: serpin family protein [Methanogenium sp.]|jgi:serpin B